MTSPTLPPHVETIVVGAGAAGAVIASRITEDDARQVLLLESGPDADPDDPPADLAEGRRNSMVAHDWGLWHRPTTRQLPFPLPRGRVVGGSSAVNTCIALRGTPEDFDDWADRGLSEWSWDQCLPAFLRLESDLDHGEAPYHGSDGPLPIRRDPPEAWTTWHAAFVAAARRMGFPDCPDTNAPDGHEGVGSHAFNRTVDHRRISAAMAWLPRAVRARPNLTLVPEAHVLRVTFAGRKATGVEVLVGNTVHRVGANRVVLSAGAIHTPGILVRSGVGAKDQLDALGVPVVADVPAIGSRLLDHPGSALFFHPKPGVVVGDPPIIQTVLRTRSAPDPHPAGLMLQAGGAAALPSIPLQLVTIMLHLGRPRGHGTIRWTSADPFAKPVVNSRMFEDPVDRAAGVEGLRLAWQLAHTPEMRELATPLWPPGRVAERPDRLDAWIRRIADSGYHPSGTVPMGADDDPEVATDGRGRVRGTEGLVVADASLMPSIPSSNIHLPTLMIGERFGAWLREAP